MISWTIAHQAPLSIGFSSEEYWSGLPLLSPGDLPYYGIKLGSPTLQSDSLPSEPLGKPIVCGYVHIYLANLENSAVATGLEKASFHSNPMKGNAKECSYYHTIALISHANKVMLRILKVRLQQYMNHEIRDVQAEFTKGRRTRDQIANIHWIIKKAREFQKTIYFCFIDSAKGFDCVNHKKLWKSLQEMGISDHLTYLLRNLYAGQEATVRTGPGTTDWFQIGKGVCQGCILSPCLFNLYAEYIMGNAGLEEAQAGIKTA